MRKLVLKTTVIVLSCMLVFTTFIFGAFALYKPQVIGDLSFKVGNYSVCCWAYSKQYALDESDSAFDQANFAYQKYADSLIDKGEYQKATDLVINAKLNDKPLSKDSFVFVKTRLSLVENEGEKQDILKCIERIDEVLK